MSSDSDNFIFGGDTWKLFSDPALPASFSFSSDIASLELHPVSFGILDESSAYVVKHKVHSSLDGVSSGFETQSRLPFGSEPEISRRFTFSFNHAEVLSDVNIKKPFEAEMLSVDPLMISGDWEEYALIELPESSKGLALPPEPCWKKLPSPGMIFDSGSPFLIFLLRASDGRIFELASGDDLWRWNRKVEDTSSSFTIERCSNGISLERKVVVFPEKRELRSGNRRFRWYFAWSDDRSSVPDSAHVEETDIMSLNWPSNAFVSGGGCLCWQSSVVRNRLRSLVRSLAASASPGTIYSFSKVLPGLCDSASHMGRGGRDELLHWDIIRIFEFASWAERQLMKKGGRFRICAPADGLFAHLPSMTGLVSSLYEE